jgi:hypothetical protein
MLVAMPKFEQTFCSSCGEAFGPGYSGYSHCDQHKEVRMTPTVERVMKQFESALARKRAYGPPSTH